MRDRSRALRWTGYVAVAVVFATACAFLSNWQFSRNAERAEQLALVAANFDADPVPLSEVIAPGDGFDEADTWRPVILDGTYLTGEQLLVRNRAHGGTSAFEVLVPLRLDDGRVVFVDRGWVPPGEDQPLPDAVPAAPAGDVTVVGRLRPDEALPASGRTADAGQLPTLNVAAAAEGLDASDRDAVVPGVYAVMATEDPAPPTRPDALEPPSDDPGPHLSYAIQWILFAVMGFVFIGYVIRTERRHRREDRAEALPRDRDSREEDAILDAAPR